MVFDSSGPIFQVADAADLRFGATDDFFIVARVTIEVPYAGGSGCLFHYLVTKFASNQSAADETGPLLVECTGPTGPVIYSGLQLGLVQISELAPATFTTGFDVVSLGRNASGTHIESFAGGTSTDATVTPVDVSSPGIPLAIGGVVLQGTPQLPYGGKVNRLYVFHAPANTFGSADFQMIRSYVANAAPLP
jgi:hypothetical protein